MRAQKLGRALKTRHLQHGLLAAGIGVALAGATASCGSSGPAGGLGDGTSLTERSPDICSTPNEGCACSGPGTTVSCGKVEQTVDDYVTCSMGTRTCTAGVWGACDGDIHTKKFVGASGLHFAAVDAGIGVGCAANPCDPYCNAQSDPDGGAVTAAGFVASDAGGITLSGNPSVGAACTGLTISAAASDIQITAIDPVTGAITAAPSADAMTASFTPAGCAPTGTQPTWTLDRTDVAGIDGLGKVTLFRAYAGTLKVTGFFQASSTLISSNVVTLTATVNVVDTQGVAPDMGASSAQAAEFSKSASVASASTWLYPYGPTAAAPKAPKTYFPLGLLAPVAMYKYPSAPATSGANVADAAKLSLRYPAGTTPGTPGTFNYSLVVSEWQHNVVAANAGLAAAEDPQIVVPQPAWVGFEQTARGKDAQLVLQRWTGGAAGVVDQENPLTIHFVDGQLKGNVYYNSYNSVIAGSTPTNVFGGILKIDPNAQKPVNAFPVGTKPNGKCTVCHSVNAQGTTLLVANGGCGKGTDDDSCSWQLPSVGAIAEYASTTTTKNKFNWSAPYPDGSFYFSNRYDNYHSSTTASGLVRVSDGASISSTGAPASAVTPSFSDDGKHLAYDVAVSTGASAAGPQLQVSDFAAGSAAFTNSRTVALGGASALGYPAFLPDSAGLVFQKTIRGADTSTGSTALATWYGALSEIWMTSANNTSAVGPFAPIRLNALNGYDPTGANYLPTVPRDVSTPKNFNPEFHGIGNTAIGTPKAGYVYDTCGGGYKAVGTVEDQLNFSPTVNPKDAGGVYWVIFTSRRMYGNLAIASPWQAERNESGQNGAFKTTGSCKGMDALGPASGQIETKKLWVAAVDENWQTSGVDPSHAAFYLPGQELQAGNSRAYWVDQTCGGVSASCVSNDDCCQGGAPEVCRVNVGSNPPASQCALASSCQPAASSCTTDADCCAPSKCAKTGSVGVCATGIAYAGSTYTQDYAGSCPASTKLVWQLLEYQSVIPASTSLTFNAQSATTSAALASAPTVSLGQSTATTPAYTWDTSTSSTGASETIDAAFKAASQPMGDFLRLRVAFSPAAGTAPTLSAWQVFYDCVPYE